MSKSGNKELAAALTNKHGLTKAEAEMFVSAMFEVLSEALQSDKQVKIKGLGTFKVIGVASRKSVDVNTGEPIIIDGRDKITFVPETSLRDEVNRPFAQFETIVLNEGVDFSKIDEKYNTAKEEGEIIIEEKPLKEEPKAVTENIITKGIDQQVETQENINFRNIQTKDEQIQAELITKETIINESETANNPILNAGDNIDEQEERRIIQYNDDDEQQPAHSSQDKTLKYICIAATFLIIILGVSAFYLFNQIKLRDNRIEHLESQIAPKATYAKKATYKKAIKAIEKEKGKNIKSYKTVIVSTNSDNHPNDSNVNNSNNRGNTIEKNANTEINSNSYQAFSKKDARIRTGAYVIIGIDHTITVKSGQTLSSISRTQLGPGMECYIEAVNNGRTEFKIGEEINIPKLKLKKLK